MNMKKMTAVCVLLASGGLPHALADSSSGLPGQSVSSQMAASTVPDEEGGGEVGGDGEGGEAWCRHSPRAEDHRNRLRRTECCQTASCRSSPFCNYW